MSTLSLFHEKQEKTLTGVWGEFEGSKVLFVMDGDKTVAVDYEGVRVDLDGTMSARLSGFLVDNTYSNSVAMDGTTMVRRLIPFAAFIDFCMRNPSPRLDGLRRKLSVMAESVQNRGSFIAHGAGPQAFIPPGLEENQSAQMLAVLMHSLSEQQRTQKDVGQLKGDVSAIKDVLAMRGSHMTVAAWFALHGEKPDNSEIGAGGMRVAQICRDRGWKSSGSEMNGSFPAKRWPIDALKVWWVEMGRCVSSEI